MTRLVAAGERVGGARSPLRAVGWAAECVPAAGDVKLGDFGVSKLLEVTGELAHTRVSVGGR